MGERSIGASTQGKFYLAAFKMKVRTDSAYTFTCVRGYFDGHFLGTAWSYADKILVCLSASLGLQNKLSHIQFGEGQLGMFPRECA